MKSLTQSGCIYQGIRTTAYQLNNDWYLVRTCTGLERVHRSHGALGLVGPLGGKKRLTEDEQRQLDIIYTELATWLDADDIAFYDAHLASLPPDAASLYVHDDDCCSIPIERCVRCQDSYHHWYLSEYGEIA